MPATSRTDRTNRRRDSDHSDVVNAALVVEATSGRFKSWWTETHATLPDDFELAV